MRERIERSVLTSVDLQWKQELGENRSTALVPSTRTVDARFPTHLRGQMTWISIGMRYDSMTAMAAIEFQERNSKGFKRDMSEKSIPRRSSFYLSNQHSDDSPDDKIALKAIALPI